MINGNFSKQPTYLMLQLPLMNRRIIKWRWDLLSPRTQILATGVLFAKLRQSQIVLLLLFLLWIDLLCNQVRYTSASSSLPRSRESVYRISRFKCRKPQNKGPIQMGYYNLRLTKQATLTAMRASLRSKDIARLSIKCNSSNPRHKNISDSNVCIFCAPNQRTSTSCTSRDP